MHHDFLDKYSHLRSPVHRLDARVKIVFFFLLIVACVSTPADHFPSFFLYLFILAIVWVISTVPLAHVLRKSLVVIPFVVLVSIFIPFIKTGEAGGGFNLGIGGVEIDRSRLLLFWNVLIKSYTAVITLILLNSTTGFSRLLSGFRALKMPVVFVDMLSFFYRYIFVIIDEAQRMKRALDARIYRGRWLWQAKVIGGLLGVLFLRSYERGERVYLAMCARGGPGSLSGANVPRIAHSDAAFLIVGIIILSAIRFLVR